MACRVRTTGIIMETLPVEGGTIELVQMGGPRSERKKWAHCFTDVSCLCFAVNLALLTVPLYEDENIIGFRNDCHLLSDLINSKWFVESRVVIVGTHIDIVKYQWSNQVFRAAFSALASKDAAEGAQVAALGPVAAAERVISRLVRKACAVILPEHHSHARRRAKDSIVVMPAICSLSPFLHQRDLKTVLYSFDQLSRLQHFKVEKEEGFVQLTLAPHRRAVTAMLCVRKKVPFLMQVPKV